MAYIRIYLVSHEQLAGFETAYAALRAEPGPAAWDAFAQALKVPFVSRKDLEARGAAGDWDSPESRTLMRRLMLTKAQPISISDEVRADLTSVNSGFLAAVRDLPTAPVEAAVNSLLRLLLLDPAMATARTLGPLGGEAADFALLTPPEAEILARHAPYIGRVVQALDGAPLAVRLMRRDLMKLADLLVKARAPYPHLYAVLD